MSLSQYDVAVIGAGPAGIAAALHSARKGLVTGIFDRMGIGGTVAHGAVIENIPGLKEPLLNYHFWENSRKELDQAGVQVHEISEVRNIDTEESPFHFTPTRYPETGKFIADAIILATGVSRRKLPVPGAIDLEGRGVSYSATCDGPLYQHRKVAVIGGGNSAACDALFIAEKPCKLSLIFRSSHLKADKKYVTALKAYENIKFIENTIVTRVHGDEAKGVQSISLKNLKTGNESKLRVKGIFVAIGTEPCTSLPKKLNLLFTEEGYLKVDPHQRTDIPGLYAAGDLTSGSGNILVAMGEGVRAAMTAHQDLMETQQ
ncbi:MAG: NAD(P)/FAD-dependent oxidoreductase [Candidatus Hodarchaeales archaeon]|jgi:thioredoxin reductase (NADPH)